jgi:hypothetical protein
VPIVTAVAVMSFGGISQAATAGMPLATATRLAQTAPAQDGWSSHRIPGVVLQFPGTWKVTPNRRGDEINASSPRGERNVMVWWWFPDEPLLGYPDIVSHRKVTVAGRPALRIHTRSAGSESLSVTFDRPRADGKRLRIMLEAKGPLARGDDDFDGILSRLQFADSPPKSRTEVPRPSAPSAERPGQRAAEAQRTAGAPYLPGPDDDVQYRVWLGPVSFELPPDWEQQPDPSGLRFAAVRPDAKAEILVILWPEERPMPNKGIERIEHTVVADEPVTRLRLRSGKLRIEHLFFDRPFGDGSRLSVAHRALDEPVEDGAPLFELVLASLSRDLPPPAGSPRLPLARPAAGDPFEHVDLDELRLRRAR